MVWEARPRYEDEMLPPQLNLRERLRRIPTTDLYFLNPLNHLRNSAGIRLPPLRILAPNIYTVGSTGVIVRYGAESDLRRLEREGVRRIVYIIDDDIAAGADDPDLPARYRAKLAAFAEGAWPALSTAADIVIVPGAVLAAAYSEKARVVQPAWHVAPASAAHFDQPRHIEMAHLGTGSHAADFASLAPTLAEVLSAHPNVRLTLFSGDAVPAPLRGHPQVRARRPMAWWRYKQTLPRMRFHLALYPLRDTAFNRARSANKLYEHAIVGAASLMSSNPALNEAAGPNADVFVKLGDWRQRIEEDLSDIEGLRRRHEAIVTQIKTFDPLAGAARVWREILASEA